jgi:type IV pilus assembly protein PilX
MKVVNASRLRREEGSALVIAMLLLVILTIIGIYAIQISTSEFGMATQAKMGKVSMNAAEAGAYAGIDALPVTMTVTAAPLPNGATYDFVATSTGSVPMPGFDTNWAQAVFNVRAVGHPPSAWTGQKMVDAGVAYGPVPAGTGY